MGNEKHLKKNSKKTKSLSPLNKNMEKGDEWQPEELEIKKKKHLRDAKDKNMKV